MTHFSACDPPVPVVDHGSEGQCRVERNAGSLVREYYALITLLWHCLTCFAAVFYGLAQVGGGGQQNPLRRGAPRDQTSSRTRSEAVDRWGPGLGVMSGSPR